MTTLRTAGIVAGLSLALVACAGGGPVDHGGHMAGATTMAHGDMPKGEGHTGMSQMDEHMKRMSEMHAKMMQAKTPEERNALMADHMKLMHDGMAMMGGMGDMGAAEGSAGTMPMHHQMMEKRMDMMQSMMQMMMDRMPPAK